MPSRLILFSLIWIVLLIMEELRSYTWSDIFFVVRPQNVALVIFSSPPTSSHSCHTLHFVRVSALHRRLQCGCVLFVCGMAG